MHANNEVGVMVDLSGSVRFAGRMGLTSTATPSSPRDTTPWTLPSWMWISDVQCTNFMAPKGRVLYVHPTLRIDG